LSAARKQPLVGDRPDETCADETCADRSAA
jgi:hypothetical protein